MPKASQEQRVEELSKKIGGRFKLTALVQKRVREYHLTGRTFMPNVRNLDELFELVLDQVEHDELKLRLPEDAPPAFKQITDGKDEEKSEGKSEGKSDEN